MQHHPYFDLWMHDDTELGNILGEAIIERVTIHEWPLSCVQRLTTLSGRRRIYKIQAQPSTEPTFYLHAHSPLLMSTEYLELLDAPAALLMDDVDAPRLADVVLTSTKAVAITDELLQQISCIEGELPVSATVDTPKSWMRYVQAMIDDLWTLLEAGTFPSVRAEFIELLAGRAQSSSVLTALRGKSGYVHGDLSSDNVFVTTDGYRVIDWQRPFRAPVALDQAHLLESLGMNPRDYVDTGILIMLYMMRIQWLAQCARQWFPPGAEVYQQAILNLIAQVEEINV